jgi:esterase
MEEIFREINSAQSFDKPTLFVRGELSKYITEDHKELIERLFSNSRIATIDGASHWLHAEKPLEFLTVVKNFLEE